MLIAQLNHVTKIKHGLQHSETLNLPEYKRGTMN